MARAQGERAAESQAGPGRATGCSLIRERPVEKEDELVDVRTRVTYDGGNSKKSEEELFGGRPSRGATVGADATTISKSRAARRGLMLPLPRPWRQEEGPSVTTISFLFPAGPERRQRRREKEGGVVKLIFPVEWCGPSDSADNTWLSFAAAAAAATSAATAVSVPPASQC